jgi:hypothetical protein
MVVVGVLVTVVVVFDVLVDAEAEVLPPPPQPPNMPMHKAEMRRVILFFDVKNFIFTPSQPWNAFVTQLSNLLALRE